MSLPISKRIAPLLALTLAACGGGEQTAGNALAQAEAEQRQSADANGRILCAVADGEDFQRVCTVDRIADAQGVTMVVRHPDGGFNRLRITRDGRGVIAADGANSARVSIVDPQTIEVAIGGARYRLPARVGPVEK